MNLSIILLYITRAAILAKNESYRVRNLAMHASKKWALTLILDWKSRNPDAQATVKQ